MCAVKISGKTELTAALLGELFSYDASTGIFTRKVSTTNRVKVGDVAGSPNKKGYINIMVLGRLHPAHRLAWLYAYGVWPRGQIDHINGVKSDNRLANLREATNAENRQNLMRAPSQSQTGLLGVGRHTPTGKWRARICVNGTTRYLGNYSTQEEAYAAYLAAKRELHEFGEIAKNHQTTSMSES